MWWDGPLFIKTLKEESLKDQKLCENILFNDENSYNNKQFQEEFNNEVFLNSKNLSILSEEKFSIENIINVEHFSNVNKLYRVTAWVFRFVNNSKQKWKKQKLNLENFINSSEIQHVKLTWIRANQYELKQSKNFKDLDNSLSLQKDENNLYRSTSRINKAKY